MAYHRVSLIDLYLESKYKISLKSKKVIVDVQTDRHWDWLY